MEQEPEPQQQDDVDEQQQQELLQNVRKHNLAIAQLIDGVNGKIEHMENMWGVLHE